MAINNLPSLAEFNATYAQNPGWAGAVNAGMSGINKGLELSNEIAKRQSEAKVAQAEAKLKQATADHLEMMTKAGQVDPGTLMSLGITPPNAGTTAGVGGVTQAGPNGPIPTALAAQLLKSKAAAEIQGQKGTTAENVATIRNQKPAAPKTDPKAKADFQDHLAAWRSRQSELDAAAKKNQPGLFRQLGSKVGLMESQTPEQKAAEANRGNVPTMGNNPDQAALDYLRKNHPELANPTPEDIAWAKTKI